MAASKSLPVKTCLLGVLVVSFVVSAPGIGCVVGALGAKLLLGEHLSPMRWAGTLLVTMGGVGAYAR